MLKYFLLWFPMLILAIINGAARDLWYTKYSNELIAHQISTVSLMLLLGIYIAFVIKKHPPQSETESLGIGLVWMMLTLGFEFGFGLYRGNSWAQLLDAYNITKGHLWLLIPIWLVLAPYLFFKLLRT
ncbi:hypothetical protein [Flavobacterium sangjuense]|uniref:Uncharacterized protein n=1 Tax=Flavobacterium sangjuense TaxID=2518177 RepID=A0A4P7PVX3_9FLAO|nr:hypothetical protein [Flavobacterium sangjuense]QBZ98540.1 hypothetical protein GS03_02048 [Flavobacterium sangjuense]